MAQRMWQLGDCSPKFVLPLHSISSVVAEKWLPSQGLHFPTLLALKCTSPSSHPICSLDAGNSQALGDDGATRKREGGVPKSECGGKLCFHQEHLWWNASVNEKPMSILCQAMEILKFVLQAATIIPARTWSNSQGQFRPAQLYRNTWTLKCMSFQCKPHLQLLLVLSTQVPSLPLH